MKCIKCGQENRAEAKFCDGCGNSLQEMESPATIDYQHPQSYTPKHLADKILTTRSAIEGERKIVTVMFADVAGFSTISEKLDPEKVHAVMDGCFRILLDQVHACEGTVNEFRGDGVMALFGAPIAHEDHAQRACYAALAIQHALVPYGQKLREDYGIDFKMRIGLNSGSVVVGAIGDDLRMDYTAQGDTANLAARMESSAQPGTVLVAEATYRLVGDAFEFESQGQITVKGKEKPVAVYRLKDKAFKARARSEREVYSEMVGRDQELDRLELQILKAVNGEGSVVNVVGEAGIGKSRLMAELKKREVVKRVMLLEGRAISMGKNLSFYPIIALLKNWAHIREDDGEAAALNKLQESIRRVSVEEADEIFPFVATLMGMKLSGKHAERIKGIEGEALEKLIFKNVREILIRSTELIPIVIVIEDLHWADTSSLILIDALYRLSRSQKVVFINVFRPGYWENAEKTPANLKDRMTDLLQVELVLQPLDSKSSETLINNMLNIKGLHHGIKTRIIERAGGNPFFIEEVVRGLIDEGAVVVIDGGFEVTDKINSVVIPPTINDVLMARIDRLDEESRNVIKVASVIGRSFFYRILADVISRVDGLDDKLAYLKQIQLIRERMQMNELEYLFKHALAQEAAYESTLFQQRKTLHLKVAQSIEKIFQERLHEFYGMLAFHYSKGEDLEKAEEYMTKAGEEALRSSASSEALNYFQDALKLYDDRYGNKIDPEKVMAFKKNLAMAHFNRGQFAEALHYFVDVLSSKGYRYPQSKLAHGLRASFDLLVITLILYSHINRKPRAPHPEEIEDLDLRVKLAQCAFGVDHERWFVEAVSVGRMVLGLDLSKSDKGLQWASNIISPFIGISLYSLARKLLKRADSMNTGKNRRGKTALALMGAAISFAEGLWNELPDLDIPVIDLGLRSGDLFESIIYPIFHGNIKLEQGFFDQVELCTRTILSIADQYAHNYAKAQYHKLRTSALLRIGSFEEASAESEAGILVAYESGLKIIVLVFIGNKAIAQALLGNFETARSAVAEGELMLDEGLKVIIANLMPLQIGRLLTHLGFLQKALLGGNQSDIVKYQKAAYHSAKQMVRQSRKFAPYRTWIIRLMGDYYWLIGKQRKALKWYDKSIKEGERLGARPDLSRTYMEVGKRLLEPQSKFKELNGIIAPEYLNKAETLFRAMDLQWDLEQLERVRAGA
jgi:class 3 adenylate cyclase/tetratricopeptide (TPR) repeat protein